MEQDKTKILSDLYAIRATMSVVAERDDAVQPEREIVQRLSNELSRADSIIESSKDDLGKTLNEKRDTAHTQLDKLRKERDECEKKMAEEKDRRDRCEKDLSHTKKIHSIIEYLWDAFIDHVVDGDSIPFGIWIGILIVGVIVSFGCATIWGVTFWMGVLYNILIVVAFILLCMFITALSIGLYEKHRDVKIDEKRIRECNYEIKQSTNRIQEIDCETEKLKEIYAAASEHMKYEAFETEGFWKGVFHFYYQKADEPKYHYAEIDKLIQEHEEKVAKLEGQKKEFERQRQPHQEIMDVNAEETALIVKEGTAAYPLIDFRDWENVDLLIYYFETGRADDMKEALQLVDKQRQADQITEAIAMASAAISKTIDTSLRQLGGALAQSFSVLSRQMAQQHTEMRQQAEEQKRLLETQVNETRAQTAEQRNAQAMNQALLNKISVSSKHLADQMDRQMREVHGLY